MNIHILPDDTYVDEFINYNELYFKNSDKQEENIYVVDSLCEPRKVTCKNIVWLNLTDRDNFLQIVNLTGEPTKIFFNGLTDSAIDFINEYSYKDWKFFWIYWGWDLYRFLNFRTVSFNSFISSYSKSKFKGFISYFRNSWRPIHYRKQFKAALNRIDYVLGNNKHEIALLERQYGLAIKTLYFVFKNIIDWQMVDKIQDEEIREELSSDGSINIFLGNSATITNNHFEIIRKVSRFRDKIRFKLYVPLSYGDVGYKKKLIEFGNKLLGDHFVAVTNYLSSFQYLELMNKMDLVIMNHYRSQALGNIYVFLYLGKPVFLNSKCPTTLFLDDLAVKYFDVDSIRKSLLSRELLTKEERNSNAKKIIGIAADEMYFDNLEIIYNA